MTADENNNSICLRGLKNRRLDPITAEEAEAAAVAHQHHRRNCHQIGIAPQPREQFVAEWLECRRQDWIEDGPPISERENLDRRDYGRMFDGKRGFEP